MPAAILVWEIALPPLRLVERGEHVAIGRFPDRLDRNVRTLNYDGIQHNESVLLPGLYKRIDVDPFKIIVVHF
jgi:hypothetical protein